MEMASLESRIGPITLNKPCYAFLPVCHDYFRRRESNKAGIPSAIAFAIGKLPEYLVLLCNCNQCA